MKEEPQDSLVLSYSCDSCDSWFALQLKDSATPSKYSSSLICVYPCVSVARIVFVLVDPVLAMNRVLPVVQRSESAIKRSVIAGCPVRSVRSLAPGTGSADQAARADARSYRHDFYRHVGYPAEHLVDRFESMPADRRFTSVEWRSRLIGVGVFLGRLENERICQTTVSRSLASPGIALCSEPFRYLLAPPAPHPLWTRGGAGLRHYLGAGPKWCTGAAPWGILASGRIRAAARPGRHRRRSLVRTA